MRETRAEFEARCKRGARATTLDEHTAECVVLGDRRAFVDTRDKALAPWFMRTGFWESWVTLAMKQCIKPGDRFLDIGANFGWYSLVAAEAGATVVGAIEPSERCADLLERTFAANGIAAPVIRLAAWDKGGEALELEQDPANLGGMSVVAKRHATQPTMSVAVDDLDLGPIDVVKIDVEGAELHVWRGMRKLRTRPGVRIFMEFTPESCADSAGALEALREIQNDGFMIRTVDNESRCVPASDADLREISETRGAWFMLVLERKADQPRQQVPAKPRLLYISDYSPTGFGTVTNGVARRLVGPWNVDVLGINFHGDPYQEPFRVWPASRGGDGLGLGRFQSMVRTVKPHAIFINSDPWLVAHFLDQAALMNECPPVVAYMPVDSPFQIKRKVGAALSRLTTAVFYTEFGRSEAERAGFRGSSAVVPHGIDLELFRPMERAAARAAINLPVQRGTFLVGNCNRNQPRKRLDLTIAYFGEWLKRRGGRDFPAMLYLHCDPYDVGWDIPHLVESAGLVGKVLWPKQVSMRAQKVFTERLMPAVYSACDVQVSTTLGEGWGLTQFESMACGVPQIVPQYSALGEWARGAVEYVPCSSIEAHSNYESGGIGGVVDKQAFIAALDRLYQDHTRRAELATAARSLVEEPAFRWDTVAAQFDAILREAIERKTVQQVECEAVPC